MHNATLIYLVNDKRILLAMKKRGFGEGNYNGIGGKEEESDKSLKHAAVREAEEEVNVKIDPLSLKKMAVLDFFFPHVPLEKGFDQRVHVYFTEKWAGEPKETEEMRPEWFDRKQLENHKCEHYENMWPDDQHWLPLVLKGEKIKGTFIFSKEGGVERHRIDRE